MPVVKMTEMYDMKTTTGKIGVIGVHTPNSNIISKRWNGLFINYKYFRVLSCNIRVACASLLPADPLQVGVEAGSVAPQDMMNPILYRAVSNESWNYMIGRLYDGSDSTNSIKYVLANPASSATAGGAENAYYAMLGESGWKKALPQSGFSMRGLKPLVHTVVDTYGNIDTTYGMTSNDLDNHPYANNAYSVAYNSGEGQVLRGRAVPYPKIACTRPDTGSQTAPTWQINDVAKTYVACIVLPPGKLTEFYFRLVIDWYIEFTGITSLIDKLNYNQLAASGSLVYATNYTFPSASKISDLVTENETVTEESTVDSIDTDLDLIMES